MKRTIKKNIKSILSLLLLTSVFWQTLPVGAQQRDQIGAAVQEASNQDAVQTFKELLRQGQGAEFSAQLEKIFGDDAKKIAEDFEKDAEQLFQAVTNGARQKAVESLRKQIEERRQKSTINPPLKPTSKPESKSAPKPLRKTRPKSKNVSFNFQPAFNWRQLAFGFQPLAPPQDEKPEIKFTQTDKEITASGAETKNFETAGGKATRTQKAETRYIKDGTTFGVEIKNSQIVEAVSKTDGKTFRTEVTIIWGAEVAACPDAGGVTSGKGKAKIINKTVLSDGVQTSTVSTEIDIQADLTGYVDDQAQFKYYDMRIDAYLTNSGHEEALRQKMINAIKIKDGRYGIRYDSKGNTIEVSDGKYGGERTPAKMGKTTGEKITPQSDADIAFVGSVFGSMIPAVWVQANDMYETAQQSWRNGGCVEVICQAPKQELKTGESVEITAETVHLKDKTKVNARLDASSGAPESQFAEPQATFTFTNDSAEKSYFTVTSTSKRGIGESTLEFQYEPEEASEDGAWTGTIEARRRNYTEREKRSGANLAENGGYFETITSVKLKLTGRLDRTVEATNANIAVVTGDQTQIDHEYDRYNVDEGYCGPNAVPYKGEKEITRTSTTKANFNKEMRVYVEIGGTGGTITFSLPETNGRTVHQYVHQSPCPHNDRVNTSEAVNEDVPSSGGNFSFSFPVEAAGKTVRGTLTLTEEDGSKTEYIWELRRR